MNEESIGAVLSAIAQRDEAAAFILDRMGKDVERLAKLGVNKEELVAKLGLVPSKGRPKGSRNRKPKPVPVAAEAA